MKGYGFMKDIIEILQQNARISDAKIAEIMGITEAEAEAEIKRLEAEGVIKGYSVIVNDELYDKFIATAKEKFAAKYGHEPKVYDVVIGDGARRIS